MIGHTLMREDRSYINPREYGSALTHTTLQAALTAIGSTPASLLLTQGTWTIGAHLTIPANVTLVRARGAMVSVSATFILTLNGDQEGPLEAWITGAGSVTFGRQIPELWPEWWGAIADGTTDCTAALNTAASVAANQRKVLRLGVGTYTLTDTWWITPQGSTFLSNQVVGAGRGYFAGSARTAIDATAVLTKPALAIQCARSVHLSHFFITGPNTAPTVINNTNCYYDADWVTAGVRDDRYSPQCGIGIDIGMGPTPPGGGYAGVTYRNQNSGTVDVTLDHMGIRECVVSLMHNPENGTGGVASQGDVVTLYSPYFQNSKVHVAVGQSQARMLNVFGGNMQSCRDVINTMEYGQQQGSGVSVHGTQMFSAFQLLVHNPGFSSTVFSNVRAESIYRLGNCGTGVSTVSYPCTFIACDIHLGQNPCPVFWDSGSSPFEFVGGCLSASPYVTEAGLCIIAPTSMVRESFIEQIENRFRPYIGDINQANSSLTLENVRVSDGTAALTYNTTGRVATMTGRVSEHWTPSRRRTVGFNEYLYLPGAGTPSLTHPITAGTYVFTATTIAFNYAITGYFVVGDILTWRFLGIGNVAALRVGPALRITSIAAGTVTCARIYEQRYYDDTYAPTSVSIVVAEWAPGQALTGDLHSNTTIDNVSPTGILQTGDWIKAGSGIPANTRVVSGGGTGTITLNRATTVTATGVKLYFGQLMLARVEPAFDGLNDDRGTVTLVAGTATVTFAVPLPNTTYRIAVSGPLTTETLAVTAKTVTGFTISSSTAGSTSVVDWIMSR